MGNPEANQTIYAGRTIVGPVIREKAHPSGGPTCDPNKKNPKGETGSFWMGLATTPLGLLREANPTKRRRACDPPTQHPCIRGLCDFGSGAAGRKLDGIWANP